MFAQVRQLIFRKVADVGRNWRAESGDEGPPPMRASFVGY